jgi:hypothetical protein
MRKVSNEDIAAAFGVRDKLQDPKPKRPVQRKHWRRNAQRSFISCWRGHTVDQLPPGTLEHMTKLGLVPADLLDPQTGGMTTTDHLSPKGVSR